MIETKDSDLEIVARYTDQPTLLPPELRRAIERRWDGAPVQLYAMADLDPSMRLARIWLALGKEHLAIARQPVAGGEPEIQSYPRSQIRDLTETPGLSCNVLSIMGRPGEPALAVLRYTQRQRKAIENISFVIERQLEGVEIPTPDPDREYVESLARPIRDAQALVAPQAQRGSVAAAGLPLSVPAGLRPGDDGGHPAHGLCAHTALHQRLPDRLGDRPRPVGRARRGASGDDRLDRGGRAGLRVPACASSATGCACA